MTRQCCDTCNAFLKQGPAQDETTPNGLCRANPPTPILIGAQQHQGLVNGPRKVQPVFIGAHPPRNEHEWCRAWQPVEQEEEIVAPNMMRGVRTEQEWKDFKVEVAPIGKRGTVG